MAIVRFGCRCIRDRGLGLMAARPISPDLVIVVADADAEQFLRALLQRGIDRKCLRPIHYLVRRDPMRDASVLRNPARSLVDIPRRGCRVLVTFDHHGSGKENEAPQTLAESVLSELERAGFSRESTRCVLFEPELEATLVTVWSSVQGILEAKRGKKVDSSKILAGTKALRPAVASTPSEGALAELLKNQPKECLIELLHALQLRHQPALFKELGTNLSMGALKAGEVARRIAEILVDWFGIREVVGTG